MSQDSKFNPLTERISDELKSHVYSLRNIRIFLKKETKKGLYTTTIDMETKDEGKLVAKKTDHTPLKSIQKAKHAVLRQLKKQRGHHHEKAVPKEKIMEMAKEDIAVENDYSFVS